ncbi:hypothetical protein K491DRAFT_130219 [Lophiostoma macrostomum CBS 122681]|uniref:Uncharacterized protein n=1 Tax=Lophiostoma macrostomum CBS 122681 TaxID=1314788 RepID=A0A6A6SRT2_9PLEO|nr:hypothetical protein K491DRAFT_130219 [Lophiostoma macrostomum CBS 122681]
MSLSAGAGVDRSVTTIVWGSGAAWGSRWCCRNWLAASWISHAQRTLYPGHFREHAGAAEGVGYGGLWNWIDSDDDNAASGGVLENARAAACCGLTTAKSEA